jgi:flavin reductase (DIM6/NTAB) family NADH-FMN oxidoreductase RutF
MAADHTKRFTGGDWVAGPEGLPIFEAATAVMIGRIRDVLNVEANAVVIVEIIDGRLGNEDDALVYHRRGYATPTERLN